MIEQERHQTGTRAFLPADLWISSDLYCKVYSPQRHREHREYKWKSKIYNALALRTPQLNLLAFSLVSKLKRKLKRKGAEDAEIRRGFLIRDEFGSLINMILPTCCKSIRFGLSTKMLVAKRQILWNHDKLRNYTPRPVFSAILCGSLRTPR